MASVPAAIIAATGMYSMPSDTGQAPAPVAMQSPPVRSRDHRQEKGNHMKPAYRRAAVAALLLLAACAGLVRIVVPSVVEDAVRRQIAELPAVLSENAGVTLAPPQVREVRFSPLSRTLVLSGIECRGEARGAEPSAPSPAFFTTRAEELSLSLTLRAVLLTTPLGRFLLPGADAEPDLLPVADSARLRNLTQTVTTPDAVLTSTLRAGEAEGLRADTSLLRALLADTAGMSDASGKRPDAIDVIYGIAAERLRLDDMATDIKTADGKPRISASCAEGDIIGKEWRHVAEENFRDIRATFADGQRLSLASLNYLAFVLPEKERLRAFFRELGVAPPSTRRLQTALAELVSGSEPLVGELVVTDMAISVAPDNSLDERQALRLERCSSVWRSNAPIDQALVIEGLSLPVLPLEAATGLRFPGLSALVLDATAAVRGTGPEHSTAPSPERHTGTIMIRGLATLEYGVTLAPGGHALPEDLLRGTYSDLSLRYTDEGLFAYLADGFMPSAEAAMMVIKVGLARVCSANTSENASLRAALETFVERPGTLALRSRAPFTLLEALLKAGDGDAGALFSATADPGPRTLEEGIRHIHILDTPQGGGR